MVEMKTLNCLCLCLLFAICACGRSSYSSSQGYSSSGYNSSQEYSDGNNTGFQQFCVKAFAIVVQTVMYIPLISTGNLGDLSLLSAIQGLNGTGAGAQVAPKVGAGANVGPTPLGVQITPINGTQKINITVTNITSPGKNDFSIVIQNPSITFCSLLAKLGIFKDTGLKYGRALQVLYLTRDLIAAVINNTTGSNLMVTPILLSLLPLRG